MTDRIHPPTRGPRESHWGTALRGLIESKGLTILELSRKSGIVQASLYRWINDECCPQVHSVRRLAEALEVSPSVIMELGHGLAHEPDGKYRDGSAEESTENFPGDYTEESV